MEPLSLDLLYPNFQGESNALTELLEGRGGVDETLLKLADMVVRRRDAQPAGGWCAGWRFVDEGGTFWAVASL
ncbi:hypothetical protein PspLS_06400 [Pyricularia sp. CBS 133598]|nr:hypothetical protein PspLS_06400 [Pyricularia sp. CBS 133598]